MKLRIVLLCVVLVAFCIILTDGVVNTIKTGPFTISVDLGRTCNNTNISKPVSSEDLGGNKYTDYVASISDVNFQIRKWNDDSIYTFDLSTPYGQTTTKNSLLESGADINTISLYDRTINGKSGVVGSGYLTEFKGILYSAGFYISKKSCCRVFSWDNETEMVSILKTIHITEAA